MRPDRLKRKMLTKTELVERLDDFPAPSSVLAHVVEDLARAEREGSCSPENFEEYPEVVFVKDEAATNISCNVVEYMSASVAEKTFGDDDNDRVEKSFSKSPATISTTNSNGNLLALGEQLPDHYEFTASPNTSPIFSANIPRAVAHKLVVSESKGKDRNNNFFLSDYEDIENPINEILSGSTQRAPKESSSVVPAEAITLTVVALHDGHDSSSSKFDGQIPEPTSHKALQNLDLALFPDPESDDSKLNNNSSLGDTERGNKPLAIGNENSLTIQAESLQQTSDRGPEKSQEVDSETKEGSLLVDSLDIGLKVLPLNSPLKGDYEHDEPQQATGSLFAETCKILLRQDSSKQEGFPKDTPYPSTQNPKSADHEEVPETNTKDIPSHRPPKVAHEELDGPVIRTRSISRLSDDTMMLKDFLNRVQARKAAKGIMIPAYVPPPTEPYRRSPRKALAEVDRNSPSPQKPSNLANRPGTPPAKQNHKAVEFDDLGELVLATASCRRSTRTRLFVPPKTVAGAPSLIPVRRADGTDPIVLQKSLAQELAMVTRANTRRNKGQSKPPKLTLQSLPAEASVDIVTVPIRRGEEDGARAVGWDETLVYFQQRSPPKAGKEQKRPQVRRLRKLGAMNGTPAPKAKLKAPGVEANGANGGSGPKRRSKSKGVA